MGRKSQKKGRNTEKCGPVFLKVSQTASQPHFLNPSKKPEVILRGGFVVKHISSVSELKDIKLLDQFASSKGRELARTAAFPV